MGFITIGIRATCRWQFGNQMSFGIWVYQSIESSRHWVTGKLDWIVGIILQLQAELELHRRIRGDIYKEREATVRYFIRYQTRGRRLSFIGSTIYESSISAFSRSPFRRTTLAISSSRVTTSHSRSIQHCHIVAWSIKKWRTFFFGHQYWHPKQHIVVLFLVGREQNDIYHVISWEGCFE